MIVLGYYSFRNKVAKTQPYEDCSITVQTFTLMDNNTSVNNGS